MRENSSLQSQNSEMLSLNKIQSSFAMNEAVLPRIFEQESEYEIWVQSNIVSFQLEDGVVDLGDELDNSEMSEQDDFQVQDDIYDEQHNIERFKRPLTPEEEANDSFRFGVLPFDLSPPKESYTERFSRITADVPFIIARINNVEFLRTWLLSLYEMNPFSFYIFDNPFHLSWSETNINQSNEDQLLNYLFEAITLIEILHLSNSF
jgi:hypothetical protein